MALDLGQLNAYLGLDDSGFTDGLKGASDKLASFGKTGAKVAAAGAVGIAAALGGGIVKGMNLEPAKDKLSAQLGLTGPEAAKVGASAGKLFAGAYGENLGEVNDAVGAVMSSIDGMAQASSTELEKASASALDFAGTFDIDVQKSVASVGTLMKSGLAKDAQEGFDLLTAASQRVPASMREDVLDASDEYGQFFKTLGFNGEQSMALLVDASSKGTIGIDKIGDAVKEFTIRSTDSSKGTKGAFEEIGLNAADMTDKLLKGGEGAAGATQQIVDGLLGIKDPAAQSTAAIALFGTPLEDMNATEIPEFLKSLKGGSDSMKGFAGSSTEMGKTLNDNATTNLESFKRQVSSTFVDWVGGKALPIVNDLTAKLMNGFGPALTAVTGWLSENMGVVKGVAIGLGALVAVTAAHALVLGVSSGALKAWVLQTNIVRGVTAAVTAVQWLWNAAMLANPIGLIIIGLVALGAGLFLLWKKSDTFREGVTGAFTKTKEIAVGALEWIKGAAAGVKDWLQANWPLLLAILTGPIGLAVLAITKNWDKIKGTFTAAKDWVVGTWKKGWGAVSDAVSGAVDKGRTAVRNHIQSVRDMFSAAKDWVTGTWKKQWNIVESVVKDPIGAAKRAVANLLGKAGLRDEFDKVWAWVKGWATGSWSGLKTLITDPITFARNIIRNIFGKDGLRKTLTDGVDAMGRIFERLPAKFTSPLAKVIGVINRGLVGAYNWVARKLSLPVIADIAIKGFESKFDGGPTHAGSGSDRVGRLVELHGNEHVIPASEVRAAGGHGAIEQQRALWRGRSFFMGGANVVPGSGSKHSGYPWASWAGDFGSGYGGQPAVHAWKAGQVADVKRWNYSYGNHIRVNHPDSNQSTLYAHLNRIAVAVGQKVSQGQQLGNAGWTGNVKPKGPGGAHLHLEIMGRLGSIVSQLGGKAMAASTDTAAWLKGAASPFEAFLNRVKEKTNLGDVGEGGIADLVKGLPPAMLDMVKEKAKSTFADVSGLVGDVASGVGDTLKGKLGIGMAGARAAAARMGANPVTNHLDPAGKPSFDAMISGSGNTKLAEHLRTNHIRYGMEYVISQMRIASGREGWRWRPYSPITGSGDFRHVNHVHATFGEGTDSAPKDFAWAGDKGAELVVNPQLRSFSGGEQVLTNSETKSLFGRGSGGGPLIGNATVHGLSAADVAAELFELIRVEERLTPATGGY